MNSNSRTTEAERKQKWRMKQKTKKFQFNEELKLLQQRKNDLERENLLLKQENVELKFKLEQLGGELDYMKKQLSEQQSNLLKQQCIIANCQKLILNLPSNSPFRRPLLSYLTTGLEFKDISNLFQISIRIFHRIHEDNRNTLNQKYSIGVKKKRIIDEQLMEVKRILDDILPKQSGRHFRIQEMTDQKLYENYAAEVQKGEIVSKSFFINKILSSEKIHYSKNPKFCPLCEQFEEGNNSLKPHKELIVIQRKQYMKEKQDISSGKNSFTALITQDFTQITFEGGFVQDLIICIYTYDSSVSDGLKRIYRHFIGDTATKNDISFVVGCWRDLLDENWFDKMKCVKIWSDGGPKHFKISANIKFLLSLQHKEDKIDWEYNFFPAYHGWNICDGVASQAKMKVNRTMRDEQIAIRSSEEIISTINTLNHHEATRARPSSADFSTTTLKGLKKF
jgi:hypothetical protein